jgi:hypothetical protein
MFKIGWERCPFCYREDIYASTPKHLWEEFALFVLLRPVRCHDCMRRFFRPFFALPPPKTPVGRFALKEPARNKVTDIDREHAA